MILVSSNVWYGARTTVISISIDCGSHCFADPGQSKGGRQWTSASSLISLDDVGYRDSD